MDKKRKSILITSFGIFFIILGIVAIFNAFYYEDPYNILWLCYSSLIIIGIGVVLRDSRIVKSQIYILLIPDIIWLFSLLSYGLTNGNPFIKTVNYLFLPGPILPKLVSLQHILTIPTVIILSCKFINKRGRIWIPSFIQLIIFFLIARIFTPPEKDINCSYNFCATYISNIHPFIFIIIWLVGGFLMIYLSKKIIDWISQKLPCLI